MGRINPLKTYILKNVLKTFLCGKFLIVIPAEIGIQSSCPNPSDSGFRRNDGDIRNKLINLVQYQAIKNCLTHLLHRTLSLN
jgi:hypothetical protein